jgi:Na+-driven multidrug efflux pump
MVGHLGASALASLGLASTVLTTVIGLLIFLAYATTPIVA